MLTVCQVISRYFKLLGLYLLVGIFHSSWIMAAPLPNLDQSVDLSAREQNFVVFMDALFQQIDVPLIAAEGIEGTINGRFSGSASDVIDEVKTAFNVIVYFDGAVAYLYNANQLVRQIVPTSEARARRVQRLVSDLGLEDSRHRVSVEQSGLLVEGSPRFIEQIEGLVESAAQNPSAARARTAPKLSTSNINADPESAAYKVYKLRHAWAADTNFQVGNESVTIPGVASILKDLVTEQSVALQVQNNNRAGAAGHLNGLRGQGLAQSTTTNVTQPTMSGQGKDGVMRIVADSRLNAVIVRDTAERLPAYDSLIESLDVESHMVEIEATIIDINTDKTRELGINWRYGGDDADILFGEGNANDQSLLPGSNLITAQGRGGVLSFVAGESRAFLGRIRALEEQGAASIISKPHVVTLSDVEAILGATTEFFVRVAGNEEVDLFNVPVGTLLRVTPHVFEDIDGYRIKLLVNIEDGAQTASQTVDSIPVVERANINTQAIVREGDSLLIGGLVRDSYTKSDYRIPVLGSIPGLGRLFRSDRNQASRVERLFLITPRLANGQGFQATRDLPAIAGVEKNIVAESQRRLDNSILPKREEQDYWPEESSQGLMSKGETSPMLSASRPYTEQLPRVKSPFSVEAWPSASK